MTTDSCCWVAVAWPGEETLRRGSGQSGKVESSIARLKPI